MLHLPEVMVVLGTNGVHSWCGLALPVVNKPLHFALAGQKMINSVDGEIVYFGFALDEA